MKPLIDLLWYIAPAYIANMSPVTLKVFPCVREFNFPIDLFLELDGGRILGDGKTFLGFLFGIFFGSLVGIFQGRPIVGFAMALGTMFGDCFGSFFKRRIGLPRGSNNLLLDSLVFLFFSIGFALPFEQITIVDVAVLVAITVILHRSANVIAHLAGLKEVPW